MLSVGGGHGFNEFRGDRTFRDLVEIRPAQRLSEEFENNVFRKERAGQQGFVQPLVLNVIVQVLSEF